ncbi:DUF3971 domain-containing protein [uncultured Roseobacter sp.]|uniref:YhdP family protein n=1 Tax=uncultured Roseobacter sp. TaxID=114847 RepID=UPI00262513EA|nr:DUF3971 domain-containing protein [uncultured Roseobacter sp.]
MDTDPADTPRRRLRKRFILPPAVLVLLLAALVGAAFWVKDRDIIVPGWARAQIEQRLADAVPEARIAFGEMLLIVDEGWRPRARVRDVRVTTPTGTEVVAFSELRASLSMSGLLKGQLELKSVDLSGVFLTLRRGAEGVRLSGGLGAQTATREAPNLAQLVADLDELLERPGLARLRSAELQALTLRYEDARANRAWTIDGGRLSLQRSGSALGISVDLAVLGGGAEVATVSASYAGEIGALASDFGVTFANVDAADVAVQGPAFGWLRALDAPISGSLRGGVNEDSSFDPLNATFQIAAGVIQPTPESRAIPINSARSYFTYVPATRMLQFNELSVDSKWVSGRLDGTAQLADDGQGRIEDLVGQLRLTDLRINPADFYEEPVRLAEAELDFRLTPQPFALQLGRLQVIDQGHVLTANGDLRADARGWDIAVDAQMDGYDPDRLMELWPEHVVPKTRRWLSQNLLSGRLHDIAAALRWQPGTDPETYLGFDFDQADVRFLKEMPLIRGAKGHASLLKDRFVLVVDEGDVEAPEGGAVDLAGSSFIIPDVMAKDSTPGVIRLLTTSSVTAALSMLDQPPLNVMAKADLPVALADGRARMAGTLALPLVKDLPVEAVEFDVTGQIADVRSTKLIKDRVLSAPLLDLVASDEAVQVAGRGALDGVPFDVVWAQPLNSPGAPGRVTGQIEISPEALDALKIGLPPEYVSGQGSADIDITLVKNQPPALQLSSDLRGVGLSIPPIGWSKGAGTAARFEISASLSEVPVVDALALDAPGLRAEGDVTLQGPGQLDRVRLSRLRVGNWLDAQVDLVGRGAGVPVGVALRGGTLDLRRADIPDGAASGETSPLTVALDRLQVTDAIAITAVRGDFTTGAGLDGAFSGRINGGAQVSGRLIPQGRRSAIRLTAADAGAVFASANVVQQVRGGAFELVLLPVGTGGAFDGKLRVQNTSVVDAPAMAALLNAVSIVGLFNVEGSDSLFFSEVNADFRLAPRRITLREGSAVGSSMGISMDGIYATDSGQLQMQGVITPVYILNGIGSIFTRPGEGLFAFNYSIGGTVRDPEVFVNPLTALTPGGIRDLFRGPRPDVPLAEGEDPPPPPPERERPTFTRGEDR